MNVNKEKLKWREYRRPSLGRLNPDKNIYVIRRNASTVGLFSYFITTVGGIAYAEKNGMTPVVDMKNYPNTYLLPEEVGKKNAWELFFMQPGGISLEDALKSKSVVIGRGEPTYPFPYGRSTFFKNENGILDYWRQICKKYIVLNNDVIQQVEKEKEIFKGKKVLGVMCRGTDYTSMKPKSHPIQPTVQMVIKKVDRVIEDKNFDAIYLVTEDQKIVEAFQGIYNEKLILSKQQTIDYKDKVYVCEYFKHNPARQGMDYLTAMLLLKECDGLVTGITSGSIGIMCLADKFEYLYVFDLGVYE